MSNELESDGATVMKLESFGVDGVGYRDDETETEPPSNLVRQPRSEPASGLRVSCFEFRFKLF